MTNAQPQATVASNEGSFGATLSGVLAVLASCGVTLAIKLFAGVWGPGPALGYTLLALVYLTATLGSSFFPALDQFYNQRPWLYVLLTGALALALQIMSSDTFLQPIAFSVPLVPVAMYYGTARALLIAAGYLGLMLLGMVLSGIEPGPWLIGSALGFGVMMVFVVAFARLSFEQMQARRRADALARDLEQQRDQLRRLNEVSAALAREEERNRLARDLHDTIAQGLTAIAMQLEAANKSLERDPARTRARLTRASQLTRETLADVRRSVWDLAAPQLDGATLGAALAEQVAQFRANTGLEARLAVSGPSPTINSAAALQVLRIVQEALKNVEKHARAHSVTVAMETRPDGLLLRIADDGCGIGVDARPAEGSGFGLRGMHERARLAGGQIELASAPGEGTQVNLFINTK